MELYDIKYLVCKSGISCLWQGESISNFRMFDTIEEAICYTKIVSRNNEYYEIFQSTGYYTLKANWVTLHKKEMCCFNNGCLV